MMFPPTEPAGQGPCTLLKKVSSLLLENRVQYISVRSSLLVVSIYIHLIHVGLKETSVIITFLLDELNPLAFMDRMGIFGIVSCCFYFKLMFVCFLPSIDVSFVISKF